MSYQVTFQIPAMGCLLFEKQVQAKNNCSVNTLLDKCVIYLSSSHVNFIFTNFKHFLVYIFYVNWDWGKMPFFNRVIQVKCHFSNRGFQVKCHLPTEKWGQNIQVDNGQFWKKPYIDVAVMLLRWRGWLKVPHAGIRS